MHCANEDYCEYVPDQEVLIEADQHLKKKKWSSREFLMVRGLVNRNSSKQLFLSQTQVGSH